MVEEHATLLLTTLKCIDETEDAGTHDKIYMQVQIDNGSWTRYPGSDHWDLNTGESRGVDLEINVTYMTTVTIKLYEKDVNADDLLGTQTIDRFTPRDQDDFGSVQFKTGSSEYRLDFRVLSDPIPTVRLHGIRCEKSSAGMNTAAADAIADAASSCCDAAATVIGTSPRPSRQLISKAFEKSSQIIRGLTACVEWLANKIEGPDDIYLLHGEQATGSQDGFSPPGGGTYQMVENTEIYFEEEFNKYHRFPLDSGPVTIEIREHDPVKDDIIVGSLVIDPAKISKGGSGGIEGGSPDSSVSTAPIEGGTATFDGPAVVEIANSYYGKHGGEGAVYHLCYSVGMEDWTLPANSDENGQQQQLPAPGEYYRIVARHSGKCLDVPGASTADGANIQQYQAVGGSHQEFRFDEAGGGYYQIVARHSGKCLDVEGSSTSDGGNVLQFHKTGANNQLFRLDDPGSGYYRITAKHSGKCLSIDNVSTANEANVSQWTDYGQTNQRFSVLLATVPLPDVYYRIVARHSGKCIDVAGGFMEAGTNIQQYATANVPQQQFRFDAAGGGYYRIVAKHSGLCLDVAASDMANGGNVVQYPNTGNDNQLFRLESVGEGYYRIVAKHSGLCLDVQGASTSNGANVEQYTYGQETNQQFSLVLP